MLAVSAISPEHFVVRLFHASPREESWDAGTFTLTGETNVRKSSDLVVPLIPRNAGNQQAFRIVPITTCKR